MNFAAGFGGEDSNKHETQLQKSLFDPEFELPIKSEVVSDFSDVFGLGAVGGGFTTSFDTANFLNKVSQLTLSQTVFRIRDILVWIRIRIREPMPLPNGSGFGSGSCYFRH